MRPLAYFLWIIQVCILLQSVFGQGSFAFLNDILSDDIDAPVFDALGNRLEGTNYLVMPYAGPTLDSLEPIWPAQPFLTGDKAGYFYDYNYVVRSIPRVVDRGLAWIQVRAWDARLGASYEEVAKLQIGGYGESNFIRDQTGGYSIPLPPMPLSYLESFSILPVMPEALCQESRGVKLAAVGQWPERARGNPVGVFLKGAYAYVAAGYGGLVVVDVSDPKWPHKVGGCDSSGFARAVAVAGNYAYVADWNGGLQVIDVSDPTQPRRASGYNTSGEATSVAIVGNYAYVAEDLAGLAVIDISNPTQPHKVGQYDTSGRAKGVKIVEHYALVADGPAGLVIIDIGNPAQPARVSGCDTGGWALDIAVVGNHAFMAAEKNQLVVIDVSNLAEPHVISNMGRYRPAVGIAVAGNNAYLSVDYSGLKVIDISNPNLPKEVGAFKSNGESFRSRTYTYGLVAAGNYLYLADWHDLKVIDVSDPAKPQKLGECDIAAEARNAAIARNHAYVADGLAGLQIINMIDPTKPQRLSRFNTEGWAEGVCLVGDYAYVADGDSGLHIIDISDPAQPQQVGSCKPPGDAHSVVVVQGYVYMASGGLIVIDATDKTRPQWISSYHIRYNHAYDVAVAKGRAYVAFGQAGVVVLDVSNPAKLQKIGEFDTSGLAHGIEVVGNYVYVADGLAGLQIIEMSDPANPKWVGGYDTVGYARDISVVGDYAFVASDLVGIQVIKVSDPKQPKLIESYNTSGRAYSITVAGNYVYVADGESGVVVLRCELADSAPALTSQPESKTVFAGNQVVLDVETFGSEPFSYQWRREGENLLDGGRISGVGSRTLLISDSKVEDAGRYSVVVSNEFGSVTSAEAVVTVKEVLKIDSITLENGKVLIRWPGDGVLQSAQAVAGPWDDVPSASSPYEAGLILPQQFFRLRSGAK